MSWFRKGSSKEGRDRVAAILDDALTTLGNRPPMGLELPEPAEAEITPDWARGVAEAARFVAERQRAAIAERARRRQALQAVNQIRRGVQRIGDLERASIDEVNKINAVARELGLDLL